MKKIIKKIFPKLFYKLLLKIYKRFTNYKIPIHIKNVFGFDLYQNNNDVINYSRFIGLNLNNLPEDADTRIFKFMKYFIKEGDVVIDVGANIGLMTLVMSNMCGITGKVISIEPGPVSAILLKRNLYVNGKYNKNVILKECALSDFNGIVSLFICPTGESDNQVHKNIENYNFGGEEYRPKIDVIARKLDDLLIEEKIDYNNITFIKIDTQGHEYFVLNGAKEFLSKAKKLVILCEFAPYLKSWEDLSIEEFYNLIKSFGFLIYDASKITEGPIDLIYLSKNYGSDFVGKYTDILLIKGTHFDKDQFIDFF